MSSARGTTARRARRSASPEEGGGDGRGGSNSSSSAAGGGGEAHLGLRALVQKRVLADVFEASSAKYPGWKVLILDELAMRVISAAVGMYDIMERRVTLVESLDKKRAPFPDMGAIYLLEPSAESVNKLLADFVSGKVLYGSHVFVYFLGRLPDRLLDQMKTCKPLLKRLKALAEVNIDFLAKEERAFTLDMRGSYFTQLYLRKAASTTALEKRIAERLVTVCGTLNEYPHIRYKQSSKLCSSLATHFRTKMDEFVAQNPKWWYHGGAKGSSTGSGPSAASQRERGVLLLLDRADDALTPLMHDFTYQSMVHDLLPMQGDRITFQAESADDPEKTEAKDVLLDEKDALWVELRGLHIAKVIEVLSNRIRDIMSSSAGNAFGGKSGKQGNLSMSQLASALKAFPEYREVMSKLSQHMRLAQDCMDVLKKENLMALAELEQTLATGKDEDGKTPKMNDLMDEAEQLLMNMKNPKHRLRLLLVLSIAALRDGGLRQQDRRRLVNAAELSRTDLRTLNSLESLGANLYSAAQQPAAGAEKKGGFAALLGVGRSAAASTEEESEYAASRYIPLLKSILDDLTNGNLSFDQYPSVMPMPEEETQRRAAAGGGGGSGAAGASARAGGRGVESARKKTDASSRWNPSATAGGSAAARSGASAPAHFVGGRNLVFIAGGLSYAELKWARKIMVDSSREIMIGSTAFVSPKEFMEDLELLGGGDEEGGGGGNDSD